MLETIEINPPQKPEYAVLWMHGLGADGHDFESLVTEFRLPNVRFILPHAPIRPITINAGMPMHAWYDIEAIDIHASEDKIGILESEKLIHELIEHEIDRGIPSEKIILAGFSQGGAMALFAGLRYTKKLKGILALSAYLPLAKQFNSENIHQNKSIPIMMTHGTFDMTIPIVFAKLSADFLKSFGCNISWHEYPTEHHLCQEEIADIANWLS